MCRVYESPFLPRGGVGGRFGSFLGRVAVDTGGVQGKREPFSPPEVG